MIIRKVLDILIKMIIAIGLVYIAIGIIIQITDVYFFRNSFFIGIPLLIIGICLYLTMRIYLNYKENKSTVLPTIFLLTLIGFSITMYFILMMIFTDVSY